MFFMPPWTCQIQGEKKPRIAIMEEAWWVKWSQLFLEIQQPQSSCKTPTHFGTSLHEKENGHESWVISLISFHLSMVHAQSWLDRPCRFLVFLIPSTPSRTEWTRSSWITRPCSSRIGVWSKDQRTIQVPYHIGVHSVQYRFEISHQQIKYDKKIWKEDYWFDYYQTNYYESCSIYEIMF